MNTTNTNVSFWSDYVSEEAGFGLSMSATKPLEGQTVHLEGNNCIMQDVDVYYQVETFRTKHKPGETRFCEQWLRGVIDSKLRLMPYKYKRHIDYCGWILRYKRQCMATSNSSLKIRTCMSAIPWHFITIESLTSVFNPDASSPYKHDLVESLIVKKRIKKLTRTQLTSISSHTLQCTQPGAVRIMRFPSWKASSTTSTQKFRELSYPSIRSKIGHLSAFPTGNLRNEVHRHV
ncbi:hypothetical protein T265_00206 [Opisthorchis viverrini]|uniref:Uncharacterized protein n=1 Tax=Opisthorchis viverrini TaxID=6198 RepID=A0A075A3R9_OPIVI|nr:hypothetical protein T265_00206 [Opisthorchis viverrini]KER34016.1 hypothetical protein T265_00206 [Opisthorchis viverrini]